MSHNYHVSAFVFLNVISIDSYSWNRNVYVALQCQYIRVHTLCGLSDTARNFLNAAKSLLPETPLSEYPPCFVALPSRIMSETKTGTERTEGAGVRGVGERLSKCLRGGAHLCVCVCLRVGNWLTARSSLQSHSTALEWHCRWMSLRCFSEHANSPAQTDAKCRYKLLFA